MSRRDMATATQDPTLPGRRTARPGGAGGRRTPRRSPRLRRASLPYLLLLPAALLELLVHLVPMLTGILASFKELTQFYIRDWSAAPWRGLENYRVSVDLDAPVGQDLLNSFFVTCVFSVLAVGMCWLLGTAAAIFMQENFRGRGLLRAVFLTPYALPVYAAAITWAFMFQRDNGMVNHVLVDQLGLIDERPFWLLGDNSFVALAVVAIWKTWPFAFLIVMAALQNIPKELYEAAAIDGAGIWQQIRKITMPSLHPINRVLVLVLFLWTFNDFNTPYILFGDSAPAPANLISIHIYQSSFVTWNFGTGSAMSVLLLLFLLVVTAGYLLVTSRGRKTADV
ncbi:sugar ABC transporter permease [Nonomuraea wenchangensis]|uniref:carbohydrate ABC transporter permease n=1 Tax=Nonomuraea wenchangensis TaxID=568860 RepID=UPI0033313A85